MIRRSATVQNVEQIPSFNSFQNSITENMVETDSSTNSSSSNRGGDMQPIAREFRQHYERKLQEICEGNNPECVQAKMTLQQDWIRDLTEQNDMLIRAVIELESEATERVQMLEEKLKESASCACEALEAVTSKDRQIGQLQMSLTSNNRYDDNDQFKLMQENYNTLKQTMQDVRDALTAEVADKHDAIVTLRRDIQLLEEQCKRADQQTHFKDDIIKELRKDLKHLKQEGTCPVNCPARTRVAALENENKNLKAAIRQAQMELEHLENKTETYLDGEGENFYSPLRDVQVGIIPAVNLSAAPMVPLEYNNPDLQDIFICTKPRNSSKSNSKRSSTYELEDVINNLSESVSQMMMRNATNTSCNKRIQDLENQLAESMKNSDLDIDEERNRRNVEINNLIRTIQEQEETLQSLQFQSQNLTECMNISALKGTIKELKEERNQVYQIIECQKTELRVCSHELLRLQQILQTDSPVQDDIANIESRLQDTLKANEALMAEVTILKSKLTSESKSESIYQERISELQSIISDKNVEIDRWHTAAVDFRKQLDQTAQKQAELEHNINTMQRNMAKCDIVSVLQNEETDVCREEVDVCLGELRELKGKINLEASIYSQKMEELQNLKNRCTLQNGTIEVLRRDLKDERIRQKDEVLNLKQQIRELKERGTMLDLDNRKHLGHIKHIEQKLKDLTDREQQLMNETSMRESELADRVTKSRSEEIRLVSEVTHLEQRTAELDAEVQRLRSELEKLTMVCTDRQAEMASLKTEVNLLLQKQGKIKSENGKLRAHVNNLQRTKRSANGDNDTIMRQLEQLYGDKEYLTIQNEQLQQCICTRDAELLQTQGQLEQIRSNRDEVCEESRTVVTNVRQWLHNQHAISEKVKDKVRRLERENRELQDTVQEMTSGAVYAMPCRMRGGSPTRSRSSNLIYPCNCNLNSRGGTHSPASVTSVASGSSADDSSVNYSSGSENEFDIKHVKEMSTPEVWLHKVENMTAELQRSNSYWKRKLYKTKSNQDEKQ